MPGISVVVCTWNRSESLRRTLESLSRLQAPSSGHEVVVVDNNSTDATRGVVEEFQPAWPDGGLRYVFEGTQGKQFALNAGILAARGEILAFTDDDVEVAADWLLVGERIFADPGVAMAGGITALTWMAPPPAWYDATMMSVVAGVDCGPAVLDPAPRVYTPAGTNLLVRRAVLDRIGHFSPEHYRHMDFELGMRAQAHGLRLRYDPALVVSTPVDQAILNRRYFRRWFYKQGIAFEARTDRTTPEWAGVPRWTWRQLAGSAVRWTRLVLRGDWTSATREEFELAKVRGFVNSRIRRLLAPSTHREWVMRRSQKQGEQFR